MKSKIDAKTITHLKNQIPQARYLIASNQAESYFSGKILPAGSEIVFIPSFGLIAKSEYEMFKKQFC